jgi:RHS repeat-associated protein
MRSEHHVAFREECRLFSGPRTLSASGSTGSSQPSYYRARYYDPATGRLLSEDPIRFGGGKNFYPYANGLPTTLVDPLGMNSTVSVGPGGITINVAITIYGPGADAAHAASWQKSITDTWNNNPGFGGCDVHFNVRVTPDLSAKHWWTAASDPAFSGFAQNYVYVPEGMPTNPSIDPSFFTGTIPAGTLGASVAHEFGHLLGLLDKNFGRLGVIGDPRDVMAEGDIVSQGDINAAVRNSFPNTLRDMTNGCGCK